MGHTQPVKQMAWRAPPDLLCPQAACHLCCITATTPEVLHPSSSDTYHQYSEDHPILDSKPSLSGSKWQAGFLGVYPHHTEGSREAGKTRQDLRP